MATKARAVTGWAGGAQPVPDGATGGRPAPGSTTEEQLADRYFGPVFHLALVRTHEREVARDLAQDTMLAVVRALREQRILDPARLPGYVGRTARNLICSYWRARSRRPEGAELTEDLAGDGWGVEVERAELLRMVQGAIERLPVTDREVMLLTFEEEVSSDEISRRLGLSPAALRQRRSRAVRRVREMLEPVGRPSTAGASPLSRL